MKRSFSILMLGTIQKNIPPKTPQAMLFIASVPEVYMQSDQASFRYGFEFFYLKSLKLPLNWYRKIFSFGNF